MPGLKKGFFYTLAFSSLALLILFSAVYSLKNFSRQGADRAFSSSIGQDIARGIVSLNNVSFELQKNGSHTILTARDFLPSPLSSPSAQLGQYVSFAQGALARRTNHNISLEAPSSLYALQPFGLVYSHASLSKDNFSISQSGNVSAYSLKIRLSKACSSSDCASAVSSAWTWQSGGIWVSLDVQDSSGRQVLVGGRTSGFVSNSSLESFSVNLTGGGQLEVAINQSSLFVQVSNANASAETNVSLEGTPDAQLILPLNLSVDGKSYSSAVLIQK